MYCVLSAVGADNGNANPNNFIFTIKDTKLYVPERTLLAKDLKDQFCSISFSYSSKFYEIW